MKNNEDPRLLIRKQRIDAERRAAAIQRRQRANFAAMARVAGRATLIAVVATIALATSASAHPAYVPVTYCETNNVNGRLHTFVETEHREMTVVNMTMRNTPFFGERHLVESPVVKGRPRIFDCRGVVINGQLNVVLTTMGGAEWRIINPKVNR